MLHKDEALKRKINTFLTRKQHEHPELAASAITTRQFRI